MTTSKTEIHNQTRITNFPLEEAYSFTASFHQLAKVTVEHREAA